LTINISYIAHSKASINRYHCLTVVSREYKLADHVTNSKEEFSHEKAIFTQLVSKLPTFYGTSNALVFTKSLPVDTTK
jgi:hypothetical protein